MPTNQTIVGELIEKRQRNAKHYLLADGSYQAVISGGDVHYEDENGNLQNINTDLFDEADFDSYDFPVNKHGRDNFHASKEKAKDAKKKGTLNRDDFDFQGLRVPFAARLPRNFKRGYEIGHGTDRLKFKPVGASPAKAYVDDEDRSQIHFQDAWNDTDVKLQLTTAGIKETIVLKSPLAPSSFTFEVDGPLADDLTASELRLSPAWLEDANGVRRDVVQTVRRAGGKTFVDLTADVSGLVYPVVIDPTIVTIQPSSKDANISSATPDSNNGGSVGFQAGMRIDSGSPTTEPFIEFTLPTSIKGSTITSATLSLFCTSISWVNGDDSVRLQPWDVSASWTETAITYNTRPGYSNPGTLSGVFDQSRNNAWNDIDITASLQRWANSTGYNYGTALRTSNVVHNGVVITFASKENATGVNWPKLTVNYNIPPTATTVTAPNGGETWNAQHTITWTAATDSDGDALRYQIQLSPDNAATWHDIVALTAAGATSYTYDFTPEAQSSTCKIRIRAYDGTSYGPWDESNGVFTIQHNSAPTAPTNLSPASGAVDRAVIQRLSWKHNDPNAGDTQSKFDLQWRKQGDIAWNTVSQVTVNQYWDGPANTFPYGNIEWQVRTYDQASLSGAYSPQVVFLAGDAPGPATITAPGSAVAVSRPAVEWSSFGQTAYQLAVTTPAAVAVWDSGEVVSTNKAQTVGTDLANNTDYNVKLRIKNADGIYSPYSTTGITVSYTPPPLPVITTTGQSADGKIVVSVTNPAPSGTEPVVTGNDLYRRVQGELTWIRIKTGIAASGITDDLTPASGLIYEYMVRAYGNNGTFRDSTVASGCITLQGIWLHDVADPGGTVHQYRFDGGGRSAGWQTNVTLMQFAGRSRPVAEFGEIDEGKISAPLEMLRESDDLTKLRSLVLRKGTYCYRDGRRRKMFGIISVLPEKDERFGTSTTIEVVETSFTEEV